jgi:acetyltransferase
MHEISKILRPKSLALFGASDVLSKPGGVILPNLLDGLFAGRVVPINPRHRELFGQPVHSSLDSVSETPELAVIATPAATVPSIMEQCGRRGITATVIISAGFSEAGPEGQRLEQQLETVARRYGIRFLGPNCLGVLRPEIGLNASFSASSPKPGGLGLVSQSGALCAAVLDWAQTSGVGFSSIVSIGSAVNVDFGEILDFLTLDPATESIMLYVEGVRNARNFISALRSAARVKPVVVMKSGRSPSGTRAATTHTGALLGGDDVFDAVLRRAGAVRVSSFANFFSAAATLQAGVRTKGDRLAIVTNAGGPAVMAADSAADKAIRLATLSPATLAALGNDLPSNWSRANPVDILGDATPERFAAASIACLRDDGVDALLIILTPQAMTQPEQVAGKLAAIAGETHKPVFTAWMGEASVAVSREIFRAAKIPTYRTPEAAVEGFATTLAYYENQRLLRETPAPLATHDPPDIEGAQMIVEGALAEHRQNLTLAESKALLAAFRVPILQSIPATNASEALVAAEELGFPVALKIDSPDITHKTDVGGVQLDVRGAHELPRAVNQLVDRVKKAAPEAVIRGVLVEKMAPRGSGRELMIGVATDPLFGPVIAFGLGGTMVEVVRDRAIGVPPLNRYLAQKLIESSQAADCLGPFRGSPPADQTLIEDVLLRVSEMVCALPALQELDINPLLANDRQVLAVDARIVVKRRPASERDYGHMAIHPYPDRQVRNWQLADGTVVTLRPIRPEDAAIERQFVNGLSDQSRYFRFMHAISEITPEMLARFTQIDYDREMAFIAVLGEAPDERQIGVARYSVDLFDEACEFAVVIADDWRGKGLGAELLRTLIESARQKGLRRMYGAVLAENVNMLKFAAKAGFRVSESLDDRSLLNLALEL